MHNLALKYQQDEYIRQEQAQLRRRKQPKQGLTLQDKIEVTVGLATIVLMLIVPMLACGGQM